MTRLAYDTQEALKQDWQNTEGSIAAVQQHAVISEERVRQDLERVHLFNQQQSQQTREAIDNLVQTRLPEIIRNAVQEHGWKENAGPAQKPDKENPSLEIVKLIPLYPPQSVAQHGDPTNAFGGRSPPRRPPENSW